METPPKLEFQGFEPSSHVRELIERNVQKFEKRSGRITRCSVTVRGPGAHHRLGEPFGVTIHIALPNNLEVSVGRISKGLDRRHAEIGFAINDAFRRALRQLGDKTRKLQGNIKQHSEATVGKIASLDPDRHCGFLDAEDSRRIYFHAHSVLGGHFRHLTVGDRVFFHEEVGEKGPQASTVRVLRTSSKQRKVGAPS